MSRLGKSARADEERHSHRRARNSQRNPRADDPAYTNENAFQRFGRKDWRNASLFCAASVLFSHSILTKRETAFGWRFRLWHWLVLRLDNRCWEARARQRNSRMTAKLESKC
jgi:hypothetical protein